MLKHRVIPCLLLHEGGLVKTMRFKKPAYVGDPINAIRIFNEKEVDELLVLDIGATREGREPNYALIEQFAGECFMPLSYGGGIQTVTQARRLFSLGVEKVCLQTSAMRDMNIIREIAELSGNQSVLFSLDVRKSLLGRYKVYASATGKSIDVRWQTILQEAVHAGAGEVIINAVDRDGTMTGIDEELIREAATLIPVPLIAVGGVGSLADIRKAVDAGASAVSAGAFFVFHGPHRAVLITYPQYKDLDNLFKNHE